MTAQTVIAEIKALPASERAKVLAFFGVASPGADRDPSGVTPTSAKSFQELEALVIAGVSQLNRGLRIPGETVLRELEARPRMGQ